MKRKVLKLDANNRLKEVSEKTEEKKLGNNLAKSFFSVSEIGFSISIPLIVGAFLGNYIDRRFFSLPKLTLFFIFLGLVIGLVNTYKLIIKISKEEN